MISDLWRAIATADDPVLAPNAVRLAIGAEWLVLLAWDDLRDAIEVIGVYGVASTPVASLRCLTSPRTHALRAWARLARASHFPNRRHAALGATILPEPLDGPFTAVPLHRASRWIGVAAWSGDRSVAVADPLATVLWRHLVAREADRRRRAAEADRDAMLARLGRADVGDSVVGLHDAVRRIALVAPSETPVLLLGERGTGREVVAREIHRRSRRGAAPFVRLDAEGATAADDLFGRNPSALHRVEGGTLLIDEIGALPVRAQQALAHLLGHGWTRIEGGAAHTVDLRVVAAATADPRARGSPLDADLKYRLSAYPIWLPPLRARTADLPGLVRHLAARAGRRLYDRPLAPTPDDLRELAARRWPGNVRELAAVVERAAALGGGERLDVHGALGIDPMPRGDPSSVEAVLARCHGRIEGPFGAARMLGLHPATLRSRLRKLGIDWTLYR